MIGIVLIDDHAIFREGLIARLKREPDIGVLAEAATYREALDAVAKHRPDVVITDISLPGTRTGLDVIQECAARGDEAQFLALSMHDEDIYAERVINLGGAGYLKKDASGDQVVEAIHAILAGQIYLSPEAASALLSRFRGGKFVPSQNPVSVLSNRELEIYTAIGNRLNTKQIAADLSIAPATVDTHKERIRKKLGLADSYQLFVHAYEHVRNEANSSGPG